MAQQTFKELLAELNACEEAKEWAGNKTWEEVYATCHRGDWLLWLFAKVNPNNLKELILAKGHCANTVRRLMTDERSIRAVDAAIAFGEGKISKKEFVDAAAYAAAAAAYAAAGYAADAYAADAAAAAAYAADADAAAAAAAGYAAKKENQQQTADICRKYLPIEIWNIK